MSMSILDIIAEQCGVDAVLIENTVKASVGTEESVHDVCVRCAGVEEPEVIYGRICPNTSSALSNISGEDVFNIFPNVFDYEHDESVLTCLVRFLNKDSDDPLTVGPRYPDAVAQPCIPFNLIADKKEGDILELVRRDGKVKYRLKCTLSDRDDVDFECWMQALLMMEYGISVGCSDSEWCWEKYEGLVKAEQAELTEPTCGTTRR